jgi:ABC-type proline/glycine betaine transport system substrate-binding protein
MNKFTTGLAVAGTMLAASTAAYAECGDIQMAEFNLAINSPDAQLNSAI